MKKLYLKIWTFINYLFMGLRSADKVAFGPKDTSLNDVGSGIEIQNEKDCVYKDLLRGEVTQEVIELRHEMYYSERESHKYEYVGNGYAKKKSMFTDYGGVDDSDGLKLLIIQENKEDTGTLTENLSEDDVRLKNERKYTIEIERSFVPRFRIEEFANKIVVKDNESLNRVLDVYVSKYESQFNRRHLPFLNEVKRILGGDKRSEILDFDTLSFVTYNAYGSDDLKLYTYGNIHFSEVIEYDGNYILRFNAISVLDGEDYIEEFYDETTAKKFENHEMRKGATINLLDKLNEPEDTFDVDEAQRLIGEMNVRRGTED